MDDTKQNIIILTYHSLKLKSEPESVDSFYEYFVSSCDVILKTVEHTEILRCLQIAWERWG